jgi:hypothetical protein
MHRRYKRAMLKLSGEALAGDRPFGIDAGTIDSLARQIARAVEHGSRSPRSLAAATSGAARRSPRPAWTARQRTTRACSARS